MEGRENEGGTALVFFARPETGGVSLARGGNIALHLSFLCPFHMVSHKKV